MRVNCRTKYLPSEGKWEIAGTSECRFTKTPTGDTRRCCTYYPYRRHTSLLQDFRLLLSLPYRRHTSLLPGSLEEGRSDRLGPAHGEDRAGWPGENIEEGHGGGCAGILRGGGIVSEPVGFARGIQTG